MKNLRTDWLTIGRSGPTVDGRTISPESIQQMAETYDPATYTALIWPEHARYINMGKVLEVRAVKNSEGGFNLEAVLSPNEFYIQSNAYDQKLFLSMEIQADFRKSGKAYLVGLGATDSPASAGTSEVRFSRQDPESLISTALEVAITATPEKAGIFERLFGKTPEEDEMSKEALQALAEEMKALRSEFAALKDAKKEPEKPAAAPEADKFAALEKKVDELAAKISQEPAKPPADPEKFAAVEKKLDELAEKFAAALAEPHPGGTKPPAITGGDTSAKAFL